MQQDDRHWQDLVLLLNNEVSTVLTSVQQLQQGYVVVKGYSDESKLPAELRREQPLAGLKALRQAAFSWKGLHRVEPAQYLQPFLHCVTDEAVSGPITSLALTSICRLLRSGIIGVSHGPKEEAMSMVVEAVTNCKFECTDQSSDEAVFYSILEALLACVLSPQGRRLDDGDISKIFNAAFHVAHNEVVVRYSWHVMQQITTSIFSALQHAPLPSPQAEAPFPVADADASPSAPSPDAAAADEQQNGAALPPLLPTEEPRLPGDPGSRLGVQESESAQEGVPDSTRTLRAAVSVLLYAVDLIQSPQPGVVLQGLQLLREAIRSCGRKLEAWPALLPILQEECMQALLLAVRVHVAAPGSRVSPADVVIIVNAMCQLMLTVYSLLKSSCFMQLELFMQAVLLPLGDGHIRGVTVPESVMEVAMAGLLDFVQQTGFVHDAYIACDCVLDRSNLLEAICSLLSKRTFPLGHPHDLSDLHRLALQGLAAVLAALRAPVGHCSGPLSFALTEYPGLWTSMLTGVDLRLGAPERGAGEGEDAELLEQAISLRREKFLKGRVAVAVEQFNRDHKKGFQYLQLNKLLPDDFKSDPATIGAFLRLCPGLDKTVVGELLGERSDFFLAVLKEYSATFQFSKMSLDTAFRMFLDQFRLPGEGQKIDRVIDSFSKEFWAQNPQYFGLHHYDAIHVLMYQVIMHNTSEYNSQTKEKDKFTLDRFVKNLRGTDREPDPEFPDDDRKGMRFDPPTELVTDLYWSIKREEIRPANDRQLTLDMPNARVVAIGLASRCERGCLRPLPPDLANCLNRDIFIQIWGPAIHSIGALLESCPRQDSATLQQALSSLLTAAAIAANNAVGEVLDSLVTSLLRFTGDLQPGVPLPAVRFGSNNLAMATTKLAFKVAREYGDMLRGGWHKVMDLVMRLSQLHLLDLSTFQQPDSEPVDDPPSQPASSAAAATAADDAGDDAPRSGAADASSSGADDSVSAAANGGKAPAAGKAGSGGAAAASGSGGLLALFGGGAGVAPQQLTTAQKSAEQAAARCIAECRIQDLFLDSKFLVADSLLELLRAVVGIASARPLGSGSVPMLAQEASMELMITLALRNRDRIPLLWPSIHQHLQVVMSAEPSAKAANSPLIPRVISLLLHLCRRLLPYKQEDVAEPLIGSLGLIARLHPSVAWDNAELIAQEVLQLVRTCHAQLNIPQGWTLICTLLKMTSLHPEARQTVFQALVFLAHPENSQQGRQHLSALSFPVAVELGVMVAQKSLPQQLAASLQAVDLLEGCCSWLISCQQQLQPPARAQDLAPSPLHRLWQHLIEGLSQICRDCANAKVCDVGMVTLHRVLMASEALELGSAVQGSVLQQVVFPLVGNLAKKERLASAGQRKDAVRILRTSINVVCKVFLQYLPVLRTLDTFPELWLELLTVLEQCSSTSSKDIAEAVPEALKNVLLIMAAAQLLQEEWRDPATGASYWDATWERVRNICSSIGPELLTSHA